MKRTGILSFFCVLALLGTVFFTSCASDVKRIEANTVTDLSGYWNDTDVRLVAESIVDSCVKAPAINNYIQKYKMLPVVIVGSFRNDSDEHIDTSILQKKFETALVNSGKVEFVASSEERKELRSERQQQQTWSSEETAKRLANETGADFMLIGSVKTIVDSNKNEMTRTYYVHAELVEIESNKKLWIGENSDIKKLIKRSSTRL